MNKPVGQLELVPVATSEVPIKSAPPPAADPTISIVQRILSAPGPDDFDWSTEDSVVVKPRPGVAVYENRHGDVVIRTQNAEEGPSEDHFAYVSPAGLPAVLKALKAYLP
jgi:hypothetical protein